MIAHRSATLFCLPFAGGASTAYRDLPQQLPAWIRVEALDLPGHGSRFGQPLLRRIEEAADDVVKQVLGASRGPYALFGHSMGALLAYLAVRRLLEWGHPAPHHLFLSANRAPAAMHRNPIWHRLNRTDLLATLRGLGGAQNEILDDPELMDIYEPILRADLQMIETFRPAPRSPLAVPMDLLYGDADRIDPEDIRLWARETTASVELHCFSGGHFFLFQHWPAIGALIERRLVGNEAHRDEAAPSRSSPSNS